MGDLQCPARVLLARHAEAAPGPDRGPRLLTPRGVAQSRRLAEAARRQRVSLVWSSTMDRARQTAALVAGLLSLPVTHDDRLRELMADEHRQPPLAAGVEDPDEVYAAWLEGDLRGRMYGETGEEVVERLRSAVEDVADRARGEAALLVSHGGIIGLGLAHLGTNLSPSFVDSHPLEPGEAVVLEVDSSGWVCTSWAGRRPPPA